ncbi:MAG: diadenylate cyclase [Pseudomonadota bacterium]
MGMTEDCDAIVLVVSEEDGTISIAREGRLERGLESAEVLSTLRSLPA